MFYCSCDDSESSSEDKGYKLPFTFVSFELQRNCVIFYKCTFTKDYEVLNKKNNEKKIIPQNYQTSVIVVEEVRGGTLYSFNGRDHDNTSFESFYFHIWR